MTSDPGTVLLVNPGADLYGSDRMAVESVAALVERGYTVYATVPGPGPLIDLLTGAGATVIEQPTPIIRKSLLSPRGMLQLARETLASWGPMRRLLRRTRASTVLVNTITAPLWFPVAWVGRRTVVCHVHEAEGSASALMRKALYLPLVLCDRIVINSQFALGVLRDSAPWLAGRTTVVYNAVAGPEAVTPPRPRLDGEIRLLYLGRLSQRKGPHVPIEAVRILRDRGRTVRLDLLGAVFPGNEGYEEGLRRQVAQAGLDDEVRFLGFRADVWGTIAECDIVVIPSTVDEPFGNTAVEASLAARPLIVSAIAGLTEASQAATSRLLVPPSDPEAIADAVERIADGWGQYAAGALSDAEEVAQTFSRARYGDALVEAMGLPAPEPSAQPSSASSARSRRSHTGSTAKV